MINLQPLYEAVLNGDAKAAKATTEHALAAGADARSITRGCRDRKIAEGTEVAIEVTEHLIAGQDEGGTVAGGILPS